jgi:hypothetical protein
VHVHWYRVIPEPLDLPGPIHEAPLATNQEKP